jgi:error-prone DNA polymerase
MSFALIAYQTLHLKHYHAPAFYCALLNQQPMGFYAPEVILGDARRHGVDLLGPDIHISDWRYTLERTSAGRWAIRTGLVAVAELGETLWARLAEARAAAPFQDLGDFCRRSGLPRDSVQALIRAGALDGFGARRDLLWRLGEIDWHSDGLAAPVPVSTVDLPPLQPWERTVWEYELLGYAPGRQMMEHYRAALRTADILSTWEVKQARPGTRVCTAGMAVVRQRPGTAKGMVFVSLEDESGLLDLVIRPDVYAKVRATLRDHPLLIVTGAVQRTGRAVNVVVYAVEPLLAEPG